MAPPDELRAHWARGMCFLPACLPACARVPAWDHAGRDHRGGKGGPLTRDNRQESLWTCWHTDSQKTKNKPKKNKKKKKTAQIAAMRAGRRTRIFTVPSKWPTTVLAWQAACVPSKHHLISFECPTKPLNVFLFSFFLYPVCIQTINRLLLRRAFLWNAAA